MAKLKQIKSKNLLRRPNQRWCRCCPQRRQCRMLWR